MKNKIKFSSVGLVFILSIGLHGGDVLSGVSNTSTSILSVVAGGEDNHNNVDFSGNSDYSTIGGGAYNNVKHSAYGVLVGGRTNGLSSASYGVVGGGYKNVGIQPFITIGGGKQNHAQGRYSTISGGAKNKTRGYLSTISGGVGNIADGNNSVVIGGYKNKALGKNSIAMGYKSEAKRENSIAIGSGVQSYTKGSMVIGDSNRDNKSLWERNGRWEDRFYAYFRRGYVLNTSGYRSNATGVYLEGGDGAWNTLSDKNKKENYEKIDKQKILDKLIAMPMEKWNYKAQNKKVKHIGPYAQDFNKAYNLGDGKLSISTIDSDGIALTSIQALAERNQRLNEKNKALSLKVKDLELRFSKLEKLLQ